ncbi:MAG TPA: hypothetical protein VLB80_02800 [Candidatus Babeliales bacterium]|nr:hypothetical protein [Candidatus Babeliales bacterium]
MIILFSCHSILSLIIPSISAMRKCQSIIALHIASDLFIRDIRAMRKLNNSWKVMNSQKIIWKIDDKHDIGWCFYDNCLVRIEGIYDQKWKNKITSIVATELLKSSFNFTRDNNNKAIGIELIMTPMADPKKPIICYAYLT